MYNPDLGTFDQRDPIAYKGGNNLYEYAGSDPTNGTDPLGLCNIRIRCGPVAGGVGWHCGVIAPDGVEYGLGGGDSSSGSSGTATPYPSDPNQRPGPSGTPPGDVDYPVSCPNKSCSEVQQSIQNYHDTVTPPPYNALGPNSNTYAHDMLDKAGCTVNPINLGPITICTPWGPITIYNSPPTRTPPGTIGW
jgi:hypothetical protein